MTSALFYCILIVSICSTIDITSAQNNSCNAYNYQFNNVQVLKELIRAEITMSLQRNETNLSGSGNGVAFTRWGKVSCPNATGAQLVYAGRAGGTEFTKQGGAAEKVCMPENPDYTSETAGLSSYDEHGRMFGSEYQFNAGPQNLRGIYQHNVPCAVCYIPTRAATIMIPAKTTCPISWTREYSGYLTSEGEETRQGNHRSSYNCVDANPDIIENSSANTNGALFYFVQSTCNGFACPPYEESRILSCVVCTK